MTHSICGGVVASVQLCTNHGAEITDCDLHAAGSRTLRRAGDVDSGPTKGKGCRRVDARGAEEHCQIAGSRVVVVWSMDSFSFDMSRDDVVLVVDQKDNIPDDGKYTRRHAEWGSDLETCGKPSDADSENGGESVGGYSEQLSLVGAISKRNNDRRL